MNYSFHHIDSFKCDWIRLLCLKYSSYMHIGYKSRHALYVKQFIPTMPVEFVIIVYNFKAIFSTEKLKNKSFIHLFRSFVRIGFAAFHCTAMLTLSISQTFEIDTNY